VTSPILNMLLGAALVVIGVLVTALADHIRGRKTAPCKPKRSPGIPPVESSPQRTPVEPLDDPTDAQVVIVALIAAGYKKQIASQAAWACSGGERATVEDWTRAALRRCASKAYP